MEKIEFFDDSTPQEAYRAEFRIVTHNPSSGQKHTLYFAAPDEMTRKIWVSTIRRVVCSLVSLGLPLCGLSMPTHFVAPTGYLPLAKFSTAQLRAKCEDEGIATHDGSHQQMRAALNRRYNLHKRSDNGDGFVTALARVSCSREAMPPVNVVQHGLRRVLAYDEVQNRFDLMQQARLDTKLDARRFVALVAQDIVPQWLASACEAVIQRSGLKRNW